MRMMIEYGNYEIYKIKRICLEKMYAPFHSIILKSICSSVYFLQFHVYLFIFLLVLFN
jgi:hypothetical protein